METIRNENNYPGMWPGLKIFAANAPNLDTDAAQSLVIETGCPHIHCSIAIKYLTADGTSPLVVFGLVEASTAHVGTKKVTFAIPALSTLQYLVVGSKEIANSTPLPDNGGDVTISPYET